MPAGGAWPLVGRSRELERMAGRLHAGGGLVLAGPAGVGKTRLAAECLAVAEAAGFAVVRVRATRAAAGVPLGAFAALVPDLDDAGQGGALGQVLRALAARDGSKGTALLVDDAHLLDDRSAALVHQLAAAGEVFVLATVRSGEPASDAVLALWKDGLAERTELSALGLEEVRELLVAVLGGPVDAATVHLMFGRTEGNAMFLRELVVGALEAGVLTAEDGLWRLSGQLPAPDRLVELLEARLAGLSPAERAAVEMVAVGEPLGVDVVGEVAVALEARGLLSVEEDGRRLSLRLSHPLYGDVLRARLLPLRSRQINRMLADATLAAGARRRDDVLRVATWQLRGGTASDPDVLLAGARQAQSRHDLELAERLVRGAWDAGGGFDAGLLLGLVLSRGGQPGEAEAFLRDLLPDTESQRIELAQARIVNLALAGRMAEAAAVATHPTAGTDGDGLAGARRWLALQAGQALAEPDHAAAGPAPGTAGVDRVAGLLADAAVLGPAGRYEEALSAAEEAADLLADLDRPCLYDPGMAVLAGTEALRQAGHLNPAAERATHAYETAVTNGSRPGQAWAAWALSRVALDQGRPARAAGWARLAIGLFRDLGAAATARRARVDLVAALAVAGRPDEIDEVLAGREILPGWDLDDAGPELLRADAWVCVARHDVAGGADLLRRCAEVARRSGSLAVEGAALADLARLGHAAEVAARLAELADLLPGPLAPARSSHAAALAARRPAALEDAATAFEELGAGLWAAEAAADAAVGWRQAGDTRRAAAAERRAHCLAGDCEGARTPALAAVAVRSALTARELEIGRLAAAGVPNKEIAARLYLSLHTVQNKLHTAYEKLGIQGRSELAAALRDM